MELLKLIVQWFICGMAFTGGVLGMLALIGSGGIWRAQTKGPRWMVDHNNRVESRLAGYVENSGRIADVLEWWKRRTTDAEFHGIGK